MVPPLEMVDDILTISTCGAESVAMNAMVNSFMSSKKLQLNKLKCAKIHIGKNYEIGPDLDVMKDSGPTGSLEYRTAPNTMYACT